jgi:hypothetical protein
MGENSRVKGDLKMRGRRQWVVLVGCGLLACRAAAFVYDPNDFAVEVVAYVQGSGVPQDFITGALFNDPTAALGRPTVTTTGDGWHIPVSAAVPVLPIGPAFRSFEVVSIGNGGSLTLKFSHPVADDRNNPYGIDFIVFGNAMQAIGSGPAWRNGNPEDTVITRVTHGDPGIVSVSQDGVTWYTFSDGPYADSFAPTASFRWDSANDVWAEELDPTRPVDPELNVDGMNVAQMIDAYDGSAGGTGFDIGRLGLQWIQYVRIEDDPRTSVTTEIDAVADVSACGDYKHPFPAGDVNGDCRVDMADLAVLAENWLVCTWRCL